MCLQLVMWNLECKGIAQPRQPQCLRIQKGLTPHNENTQINHVASFLLPQSKKQSGTAPKGMGSKFVVAYSGG